MKKGRTIAEIDREIAASRQKMEELLRHREDLAKEKRKTDNKFLLENIDVVLRFASHSFKSCREDEPYNHPHCPRCQLLIAKKEQYISDNTEWTISVDVTEHDTD